MSEQPRLTITIDNREDVELFGFANAMAALNNQYYNYLNSKDNKKVKQTHKLYIRKLSQGSIILDLYEKVPELLPAIVPVLVEFSTYVTETIDFLCGKKKEQFHRYTIIDLKNFKNLLEIAANVTDNKISFYLNFGQTIINNTYSSQEAAAAQNKCDREIEKLKEIGDGLIKEKTQLQLYQARNSNLTNSKVGNMGIVEEISTKPQVLSFANDKVKYEITKAENNPFNFVYNVDVEIILKDETKGYSDTNIREYIILKLHGVVGNEDLFDKKDK